MRLIPNQKNIIYITGTGINSENKQLAEDIQKSITRKFRKRKVYSCYKDNIWFADLTNMQFIIKYNKRTWFLFC